LAAAETVPVSAQTRWTISINANETGAKWTKREKLHGELCTHQHTLNNRTQKHWPANTQKQESRPTWLSLYPNRKFEIWIRPAMLLLNPEDDLSYIRYQLHFHGWTELWTWHWRGEKFRKLGKNSRVCSSPQDDKKPRNST
jgi:hypothetical protein